MTELGSPPTHPVPWTFRTSSNTRLSDCTLGEGVNTVRVVGEYQFVTVLEQTWFAARARAAVLLGVAPEELQNELPQ